MVVETRAQRARREAREAPGLEDALRHVDFSALAPHLDTGSWRALAATSTALRGAATGGRHGAALLHRAVRESAAAGRTPFPPAGLPAAQRAAVVDALADMPRARRRLTQLALQRNDAELLRLGVADRLPNRGPAAGVDDRRFSLWDHALFDQDMQPRRPVSANALAALLNARAARPAPPPADPRPTLGLGRALEIVTDAVELEPAENGGALMLAAGKLLDAGAQPNVLYAKPLLAVGGPAAEALARRILREAMAAHGTHADKARSAFAREWPGDERLAAALDAALAAL